MHNAPSNKFKHEMLLARLLVVFVVVLLASK
jgi:hypothetical protein